MAACNQEEIELPILEVRDVKKVSLVLVTGDRGLCGSYNSAVIKAATKRAEKLKSQGIAVSGFLLLLMIDEMYLQSVSFLIGPTRSCGTKRRAMVPSKTHPNRRNIRIGQRPSTHCGI